MTSRDATDIKVARLEREVKHLRDGIARAHKALELGLASRAKKILEIAMREPE